MTTTRFGLAAALLLFLAIAPARPVLDAQTRPAPFVDVTKAAAITFVQQSGRSPEKFMVETFGSGVAWLDYDGDGFLDLYFVNSAPGSANALYRNEHDGTFEDVTKAAGLAATANATARKTGVAVGDYDNDGDPDLYVTAFGPNLLFRNNGDGTFADVTSAAGVAGAAEDWSTSTGFFDYDNDGDLDLYVVNYLEYGTRNAPFCGSPRENQRTYCGPTMFDGRADRLFRNEGNGTFTDVSRAAGVANPAGKGLGVVFCDVDADNRTNVYVANDLVRNFLFRNEGNGRFRDIAYGAGVGFDGGGKPQAGMGVDCGDIDGDGRPELFVTNFADELNTLYANRGDGLFEDATTRAGLRSGFGPLGFGTKLFDFDNDGDLDIIVTNGHVADNVELFQTSSTYRQKNLLYENVGGGRFRDISAQSGPAFRVEAVGRGLAVGDYDNDGDLDVVITNIDRAPMLLRNEARGSAHWLTIAARGKPGRSNADGFGARVTITTPAGTQVREISNVASYQSANDPRLHVGLGTAARVPTIEIRWPSGTVQTLTDVAADQILRVQEP